MSRTAATVAGHPTISDLITGPGGKWFRIEFKPGEELTTHRSVHDLVVEVEQGGGELRAPSCGVRQVDVGDRVALLAHEPHEVSAGADGLTLVMRLTPQGGRG